MGRNWEQGGKTKKSLPPSGPPKKNPEPLMSAC